MKLIKNCPFLPFLPAWPYTSDYVVYGLPLTTQLYRGFKSIFNDGLEFLVTLKRKTPTYLILRVNFSFSD